ncbi:MAG: aromatic amino acid DMT transporter YddG [Rubrivivax sp.]
MSRFVPGATALGLLAILFWSTSVGVTRSTAEALGPTGAPAVLFTVSALLLLPGRTPLNLIPRGYLWLGGLLFVAYQLCFVLALGLARSRAEAIELGMVNYLWPGLTVLCSVAADRLRPNWQVLAGLGLALVGIATAASPADGLSLLRILGNARENPLCYGLALAAAVAWALYSTSTKHLAQGRSALWYHVAASACAFWLLHLAQPDPPRMAFSTGVVFLVGLSGAAVTLAYACWNRGLLHGNIHLLALAANTTPLLAALFASALLQTSLPPIFWIGAALVAVGSGVAGHGARKLARRR